MLSLGPCWKCSTELVFLVSQQMPPSHTGEGLAPKEHGLSEQLLSVLYWGLGKLKGDPRQGVVWICSMSSL